MTQTQDDVLLTFKEAMKFLKVSRSTLYRLMWAEKLTGHKLGGCWRFYVEDLRACVAQDHSGPPAYYAPHKGTRGGL